MFSVYSILDHMKKILFLLPIFALLSCSKSNQGNNYPQFKLRTLDFTATLTTSPFSGILDVYPCKPNSSLYFGNYQGNPPQLTSLPGKYLVALGEANLNKSHAVNLPIGSYDLVYWGYQIPSDTSISYPITNNPVIRLGVDLKGQGYSLRSYPRDTLYYTTEDFVYATKTVNIGTDNIGVKLNRVVAGLSVVIKNKNGGALNASIDSIRVYVGSVAERLDLYTATPTNMTKTVAIPLKFSPSRTSAYNTVTLFPSGPDPKITILLIMQNGEQKTYIANMNNQLMVNNLRLLTLDIGEIFSSSSSGNDYQVDNWTESDQTIDI